MLDAKGLTPTLVSAGKYKVEGNELSPLTDAARASVQGVVDSYYEMFVNSVARGRGYAPVTVRNGFGEGRTLGAGAAVQEHLADEVGTLADAIKRAASMSRRRSGVSAELRRRRLALAEFM
jgi:ClpP class serine protease